MKETICLFGLGYVGLPSAILLANNGYTVYGIDINQKIIDTINSGKLHFEEKGFDELISNAINKKSFVVSSNPSKADIFIVAVPTPITKEKTPDLSYVETVVNSIAPLVERGNLIVLESTSPIGTTEYIMDIIKKARQDLVISRDEDSDVMFAYCPERVLPGNTLYELQNNSRVVGGINQKSTEAASDLYKSFCKGTITKTNDKTAEFSKLIENSFRDVNIAFANELASVASNNGINPHEVISIANQHPRVNILNPSIGVGGHCIPVDPYFITYNNEAPLMNVARQINSRRPQEIANIVLSYKPKTVGLLGLAYKPNVDDFRESPSIKLYHILKDKTNVLVHDPYPHPLNSEISDIIESAELIVICTPHDYYIKSDILKNFRGKVIDPSGMYV